MPPVFRRGVLVAAVSFGIWPMLVNGTDLNRAPLNELTPGFSVDSTRIAFPKNSFEEPLGETVWLDGTGDWFNSSNWSAGVPDSTATALINNSGTAQIMSGGAAAGEVELGVGGQDVGTLSVSGSGTLQDDGSLYVARSGEGILNITNGSAVFSGRFVIGENSGSNGTATISGSGSIWMNTAVCFMGFDGNATLSITSGGQLSNLNSTSIGENSSTGEVTVDGVDSNWDNDAEIDIGGSGSGTLTISNGAHVSSSDGAIGINPGSSGLVNVSGAGSTWTNDDFLTVSRAGGNGNLHIVDGGVLSNSNSVLGSFGGTATVTVEGTGSTWTNNGEVSIGGDKGTGIVSIANGGQVTSLTGFLGSGFASSGTLEVDGAASTWTNSGNVYIGGTESSAQGVGVLHMANGGTASADSVTVWTPGIIGGNGTIAAVNGISLDGTLAPEETLSINGNIVLTSDAVTLSTVTPDAADNASIEGTASLDGALQVVVTGGPYPVGAQYILLQASGGMNGTTFSNVSITAPPGINPQVTYDANHVYLIIEPGAAARPTPTPRSRPIPHVRPTPP